MSGYQLSPLALMDLRDILDYREEHAGSSSAAELENEIITACELLVTNPRIGHRRSDLTSKPYFFHTVGNYLIVHARQTDPVPILGILHASQDVRKLLRTRLRK